MSDEVIRAESVRQCILCGSEGHAALYAGLEDRLFGAPGEWALSRCARCGLIFLDPQPLEDEMPKAYRDYYTHKPVRSDNKRHDTARLAPRSVLRAVNNLVSRMLSVAEQRNDMNAMYLRGRTPGRLLDVGCGQGDFLERMRRAGWVVEGVEPDPAAARLAREKYRVHVHGGDLPSARYPERHFDAITMNHVIEHAHDPIALLRECRRILKPGGILVVVTPNTRSWGHRKFGKDWRGLEPPRHIHLFSSENLRICAQKAGYRTVRTWTTAARAEGIFAGSVEIREAGKHFMDHVSSLRLRFHALFLQYWETLLLRFRKEAGEEVVLWVENE